MDRDKVNVGMLWIRARSQDPQPRGVRQSRFTRQIHREFTVVRVNHALATPAATSEMVEESTLV